MNSYNWIMIAVLAVLLSLPGRTAAAEQCTVWQQQADGSYYNVCVDDTGKQYCQRMKDGVVTRVSCN